MISQLLCRTSDGNGRVAVHEVLLWTDALPNTIREGQINNIRNIIESNGSMGMCTMDSVLKKLVREEVITPMEAYMKASEKREFVGFLNNGAGAEH